MFRLSGHAFQDHAAAFFNPPVGMVVADLDVFNDFAMEDFEVPHPGNADVYVCPTFLQVVVGLTPKRSKQIAQRLVEIAQCRWPKAVVKIHPGNVDYVGHFIELSGYEAAKNVKSKDIEMKLWDTHGAILKWAVTDEMLTEALDLNREYTTEELAFYEGEFAKVLRKRYSRKR